MKGYQADAAIHEAGQAINEILRGSVSYREREDLLYLLDILGVEPSSDDDESTDSVQGKEAP